MRRLAILLLALSLFLPALAQSRQTLSAALRAGKCEVLCTESGRAAGPILQAQVRNLGTQPLQLSLPEGSLFVPLKPEEQTRMVIDEELFEVPAGGQKRWTSTVSAWNMASRYRPPAPPRGATW